MAVETAIPRLSAVLLVPIDAARQPRHSSKFGFSQLNFCS
jgi:hypothetical protein